MESAEASGDVREERLRRWIAEYSEAILRACRLLLSDRGQAEDAMQDTFLKAWRHMADYEKKHVENDKAWLLRIAANTCRDYRRSAWFRRVDRRADWADLSPDPSAQGDRLLMVCVGELADKYRRVIVLYYYQRLTLQETAEALGIPVSTAHRRLRKAEALLREQWLGGDRDEA